MLSAPGVEGPHGPARTADELAAARLRLEQALAAGDCDAAPAEEADPAAAARAAAAAYVTRAQDAGVLSDAAGDALLGPLAERLRTADSTVEARHRAERAIEWALLAARRHAWREGRPALGADAPRA